MSTLLPPAKFVVCVSQFVRWKEPTSAQISAMEKRWGVPVFVERFVQSGRSYFRIWRGKRQTFSTYADAKAAGVRARSTKLWKVCCFQGTPGDVRRG